MNDKTRLRVEFSGGDDAERASEFYADWVRQEYGCEVLTSVHFDGRRIVQWALGGNAASVGWAEMVAHTLEDAFTSDDAPPPPRVLSTRVWMPL